VGAYPDGASPYGLLDMAGNVWEWCATKWDKSYPYDIEENEWSAEYLEGTEFRVLRGGSWCDIQYLARCAFRVRRYPDYWYDDFGFRLVAPI
jgi:formylglycine-generating enzyme required for sulfatase activity